MFLLARLTIMLQYDIVHGASCSALRDKEDSIKYYNRIIELNPKNIRAYNKRGLARYEMGDKDGAIEDFNKDRKLDPKNVDAYSNRGLARYDLGDKEGAIRDYTQAIECGSPFLVDTLEVSKIITQPEKIVFRN